MGLKLIRLFFVTMLLLCIVGLYSINKTAVAGKKGTTSGSGWKSWNSDDGSSDGKSHDDNSGHHKKKKKPKKEWQTEGNKNIDHDKHFLGTTDEADLVIKTNNDEKMRVTTDGDVGIGTGSPAGTLHVEGGSADGETDGKDITLDAQDGGPDGGAGGNILLLPGEGGDISSPSGKVGIGTDTPTLTLDVNGQIRIRGGSPFIGAVLTSDSFGNASWMSVNVDDADSDPENELQNLTGATLTGTTLQIDIEDGDSATVDLAELQDGTGTDDQNLEGATLIGTTLQIDIEDGTSTSVELSSLVGTDDQNLTGATLTGTTLQIDIEDGESATVDLSGIGGDNLGDHTATKNLSLMSFWLSGDGGNEGIGIDNAGNVGIGTTSPGEKLEIWTQGPGISPAIRLHDSAHYWDLRHDSTSNRLHLNYDGIEKVSILNSGNVGIGTANPIARLNVAGDVALTTNNARLRLMRDGGNYVDFEDSHKFFIRSIDIGDSNANTRLTIDTAGKVGIGTQIPTDKLTVAGNIVPSVTDTHSLGTPTNVWKDVYVGNSSLHIGDLILSNIGGTLSLGSKPLSIWSTNGTSVYYNDGNVGIGTTSPGEKLDVNGKVVIDDTAAPAWLTMYGTADRTTNFEKLLFQFAGGDFVLKSTGQGSATLRPLTLNANTIKFQNAGNNELMRINSNGNVGIGTTSPGTKLDVNGTVMATLFSGDGSALTDIPGGATITDADFDTKIHSERSPDEDKLRFDTSGTERMVIDHTGNVGIGTTSPSTNLDVVGTVNATAFTGDGSGLTGILSGKWSDVPGGTAAIHYSVGNVGIGTTSPTGVLHVKRTISSGPALVLDSYSSHIPYMRFNRDGDSNLRLIGYGPVGVIGSNDIAGGLGIRGDTAIQLVNSANGTNGMTITDGNVGIGTISPGGLLGLKDGNTYLDVDGGNNLTFTDSVTGTKTLAELVGGGGLWNTATGGIHYSAGNVGIGTMDLSNRQLNVVASASGKLAGYFKGFNAPSSSWGLSVNAGTTMNDYSFRASDVTGLKTFFTVQGNGNVGIGTTVPRRSLDVNGDIVANRITMAQDTGNTTLTWHLDNLGGRFRIFEQPNIDTAGTERLTILNTSGNVGIGTTSPTYKLHVNGTAYATGAAGALSDIRHKKNVQPVSDGALDIIDNLRPVTYEWKDPSDSGMEGAQIGFIAQEVEKALPEVVLTQDDEDKTKGLKYTEFIPVIVKAMQEVRKENETVKLENEHLREKLASLSDRQQALEDMFLALTTTHPKNKLAQLDDSIKAIQ